MARVFIGTSGFMYPHWRGEFYPFDLPQGKWFEFYCRHFNTVELNVSFYRLPKKEVFEDWRGKAGEGFIFSAKGSRFITHIKKLKDCQKPTEVFWENAKALKSGVVLWQLPPEMKADAKRLEDFLRLVQSWGGFRHAFEFRHQSWLVDEIQRVLEKYNAAVVFQDYPAWPITEEVTADFVYLRFHGKRDLYSSEYTGEELKEWASKIRRWLRKGRAVYAYFNNDALGYAVSNALMLKKLVE